MSNKRYDELMRALVPKQPTGPTHGHHPAGQPQQPMVVYPGQPYPPAGPYHHGNAPIQYPQYPRIEPGYPVEPYPEPWPEPMPGPNPPRRPQPEKRGPSGLDLAVVIFVAAMGLIFLAAALPR